VKCLKKSRKLGIAGLVILAALIPLSVLANGDTSEATDETQSSGRPLWGFRWLMGGHGWGGGGFIEAIAEKLGITDEELQEATVEVIVEDMADKLDLTDEEVAQVTPIVQEIAELREQLKTKHDELDAVIGDKLDAYRESMAGSWGRGMPRMRGMRGGCWGPGPFKGSQDEETAQEITVE
jgi:hypothetical protein